MEASVKNNDVLFLCRLSDGQCKYLRRLPGEFNRSFYCFASTIPEEESICCLAVVTCENTEFRSGHKGKQLLYEVKHLWVESHRALNMHSFGRLVLDCFHDSGMAVSYIELSQCCTVGLPILSTPMPVEKSSNFLPKVVTLNTSGYFLPQLVVTQDPSPFTTSYSVERETPGAM